MDIERLFGEIEPGVFEFKKGHRNYNPFAWHWVGRYCQIGRLSESQLEKLHACELDTGRFFTPAEIAGRLGLPSSPPAKEDRLNAIKTYLEEHMIDETDRRCIELVGGESFSWFKRSPHLVRLFGMLHAMDYQVLREGLPEVFEFSKPSSVDVVSSRYG